MFKVALRYIVGYKKKTIVCILGIAFSVMLIFSLVGISNRIMNQYMQMVEGINDVYDIKIHDIKHNVMEDIYNQKTSDCLWKMTNRCFGTIYQENGENLFPISVKGDWKKFYKTELLEGKEAQNAYDICIEETFSKKNNIELGDKLTYQIYDNKENCFDIVFKVTGIIKDVKNSYQGDILFTSNDTADDLIKKYDFTLADNNNSVFVTFSDTGFDYDRQGEFCDSLMNVYGTRFYAEHIQINEEKGMLYSEEGNYNLISMSFYAICFVVFITMVIFIYNTISIGMTEKIRQYGMLRCIGIDNAGLLKIMITEEIIYTIAGIVIGCIGGRLLNGLIADNIISCFVDIEFASSNEGIIPYIITILATFIAVGFAFASIYLKIAKQNPIEMLRFSENIIEPKKKSKFKNVFVEMATRNIIRNRSKSRILMTTILIASLLVIVIGNVITSINFDINKSLSVIAKVEVYSNLASKEHPYIELKDLEIVAKDSSVDNVYWQRRESGYEVLHNGKILENYSSIVVYSDELMHYFQKFNNLSYTNEAEEVAYVLYSEQEPQIKNIELHKKEEIYGCPDAVDSANVSVNACVKVSQSTLCGTSYNAGPSIIISESLANRILGKVSECSNAFISLHSLDGVSYVRNLLNVEDYEYVNLEDLSSDAQRQVFGMMYMAFYMMISVILLLVFVISNIIKFNVSLRAKEIGMLRSIGAEKRWVVRYMILEMMIIAIRAIILAVVIATPVSIYLYNIINDEIGIGIGGFLVGIPVILVGIYLVSKILIKNNLKSEITEIIRNE